MLELVGMLETKWGDICANWAPSREHEQMSGWSTAQRRQSGMEKRGRSANDNLSY